MKRFSQFLLAVLLCSVGYAQQLKPINFQIQEISKSIANNLGAPQIHAANGKVFYMDVDHILAQMQGVASRSGDKSGFEALINLPHPDGTLHEYTSVSNETMHPGLAAKFPEIGSFDGYNQNGTRVKWDVTPHGLHAMIMKQGESTIFIDPLFKGNNDYYIVYAKKDFTTDKNMDCSFNSDVNNLKSKLKPTSGTIKTFGTCELRTYRLALAATVEYSTFHGGTIALAQAAQVTTMNRVNGVFELDMAITMEIVANNNLIVYASNPDPYTNGTPGTMINQNQTNCDNVIGSSNYDIGHVFGTNSGGLAGLGVVCANGNKARGVTGSAAPVGDPFDIDYVAHEMGHQFGANHTQNNNCNRNNATAVEPGSASTIMGYAGICAPNVQNNSDDHFSGKSLEEIHTEIMSGGHQCEVITQLTNNAPVIVSTNASGGITVPASTPFVLTCNATDADNDPMSYNWEQMDNQVSTQPPVATSTGGPNFRSLPSQLSPSRYFPNLVDLANGGPFTWEVVPSVSRTMNFRVTVRDNAPGPGGCNDHEDVTVTVDGGSGPFVVTYPSATGIVWAGLSNETVTWSVAGTDVAPVSCSNVDILLSTDGGLTYPTVLATNVPNDGSQQVSVPNVSTTTARIMVISSTGTFFDISDNDFEITMATNDYTLAVTPATITICQPNNAVYTVNIGSVGGYVDPVTLSVSGVPAGATSAFSTNPVIPGNNSTLTISNTGAAIPGTYTITVTANSTSGVKTEDIELIIANGTPSPVTLTTPANGATGVSNPVDFAWAASAGSGVTYDIDIATDNGFVTIVESATGLLTNAYTSTSLLSSTTYYWRVRAVTPCGNSAWSATFSFTTSNCGTYVSTDVPKPVGAASVTSIITIATIGTITDVNVSMFDCAHAWVGDVSATLTSPTGTVVQLFDGPGIPASTYGCAGDDILASFDDGATLTPTDFENMCGGTAPAITGAFQPMSALSALNGEPMNGTWTLTIYDSYTAADDGTLNAWSLEICANSCVAPTTPTISGNTSICPGTNETLSIASGALNSASDWQWYEGSCGGTPVGTGTSITVSPAVATTYYVRGEGGCVTPGACEMITVTPEDNTAPSATCLSTQYVCAPTMPDFSGSMAISDNCDSNPNVVQTPAPGTALPVGTTAVTVVVSDAIGNSTTCNFDVISGAYTGSETVTICDGDSYQFGPNNLTTAGNYSHQFTNISGCDSTVNLTLNVNPVYTSSESATICDGQTYQFGPNNLTSGGVYSHVFTSIGGCDSTVNLTLTVNAAYNTNESASICDGDTYTFPDGNTGTSAQVYTSMLSTVNGCDSIIVTTLNVESVDASVTQTGATLTANAAGMSYQWVDCNNGNAPIAGATNQSYTPTATTGSYAVIVSSANCSSTSTCYTVDYTGVEELGIDGLVVYPNPANEEVQIFANETIKKIELTDAQGKLIFVNLQLTSNGYTMNLARLSSGVYFIHVYTDQSRVVTDIIKQ